MVQAANVKSAPPRSRFDPKRGILFVVLAAAATFALFHFSGRPAEHAAVRQAETGLRVFINRRPGAAFERRGPDSDQIVRVTEGTIALEVEHLAPGQRFRVVIGDAELEVRGTRFEVSVEHDRLRVVRVIEGRVELRHERLPIQALGPGERWEAPARAGESAAPAPSLANESASPPSSRVARRDPSTSAEVTENGPPRAEKQFQEGFEAMRQGDSARAAAAFEASVRAGDSAVAEDAAFWRAVALSKSGDRDKAVTALRAFLAAYPGSARADQARTLLANLDAKH
jgi:hypothetical protein